MEAAQSEVIGLKWSAIDLVGKTVSSYHKLVEYGTKLFSKGWVAKQAKGET